MFRAFRNSSQELGVTSPSLSSEDLLLSELTKFLCDHVFVDCVTFGKILRQRESAAKLRIDGFQYLGEILKSSRNGLVRRGILAVSCRDSFRQVSPYPSLNVFNVISVPKAATGSVINLCV